MFEVSRQNNSNSKEPSHLLEVDDTFPSHAAIYIEKVKGEEGDLVVMLEIPRFLVACSDARPYNVSGR